MFIYRGNHMENKLSPAKKNLLQKSNELIQAESYQPNSPTGNVFTYFKQKRSINARKELIVELRKFLAACGDFTFKLDKNMELDPNFNHYVVKLDEALDSYFYSNKKPSNSVIFGYRKLKQSIAKFLKTPVTAKQQPEDTKDDIELNA